MGDNLVQTDADRAREAALWQSVGSLIFGFDNGGVELSLKNTGNGIQATATPTAQAAPAATAPQAVNIGGVSIPLIPALLFGGFLLWAATRKG